MGKLTSRVQDPALSQAELLKVLPASVPIRPARETDTDQLAEEQDRAAQREQMEGLVDSRARAEVTRPFRSLEDDSDKDVKRQQLGEPLAAIPEEVVGEETSETMTDDIAPLSRTGRFSRKTSREPEELSGWSSEQKRMRTARLRVSSVNALQKPPTSEESIVESREVRNNEDAIKTGAKILSGRRVDDAHKEKSRCAREFATYKDPSVFAAASDVDNTSLIDLLAVKRGHIMMCFNAVAAFGQIPDTELIFIDAPADHRATAGQHVQCECLKVREGGRKESESVARSLP